MRAEVAEHTGGTLDTEAWNWLEQRLYYQRGIWNPPNTSPIWSGR